MFSFLKANVESVCVFLFLSLKCCVWNLYLIWINLCCFFFLISGWMFATCTSKVKPEDRQASMGLFPFSQQKKISQRQSGQIASENKKLPIFFFPLDTNILGRFVDDSDATVFNMTKWVNVCMRTTDTKLNRFYLQHSGKDITNIRITKLNKECQNQRAKYNNNNNNRFRSDGTWTIANRTHFSLCNQR